jgi:hypothetical protein
VGAWYHEVEQNIADFLRATGPVVRDATAGDRGLADVRTMIGCGYHGSLADFRQHLRHAMQRGLVEGEPHNFLAVPIPPIVWPEEPASRMTLDLTHETAIIDLTEPTNVETPTPPIGPISIAPSTGLEGEAIVDADEPIGRDQGPDEEGSSTGPD